MTGPLPNCRILRTVALALLLVVGLGADRAVAQSEGVHIEFRDPSPLVATQGQPVTIVAFVENHGVTSVTLTDRLVLPTGWSAMTDEAAYDVEPGARATRLLTVLVPATALAGAQQLEVEVHEGETVRASASLELLLQATPAISFTAHTSPAYTVAGEPYRASFRVANRGNVAVTVSLDAEGRGGDVSMDTNEVRLAPDAVTAWDVVVATPSDLQASQEVMVRAEATVTDPAPDGETIVATRRDLAARAHASTIMLPRIERAGLRYHTFPLIVGTSAGILANSSPVQLGARTVQPGVRFFGQGRGPLQEGGTTVLGVDVASPFLTLGEQRFRTYDFYQVALTDPRFGVIAGDGPYNLSSLATVYGFGGSGKVRTGRLGAGAFYVTNRFGRAGDELGGEVDLAVAPDRFGVGANVLRREGRDAGTFASLDAHWQPVDDVEAEAELGVSEDEAGERGMNGALSLRGGGRWGRLALRLRSRDNTFPGYRADQTQAGVSAQVRLGPTWRLGAEANTLGQDVRLRGLLGPEVGADLVRYATHSYRLNLYYGTFGGVEVNRTERESQRGGLSQDRADTYGRLTARFGLGKMRLGLRALAGFADQYSGGAERRRLTYGAGANVSVTPTSALRLSASADYSRGRAAFDVGAATPQSFSLSAQAGLRLGDQTNAVLSTTLARTRSVFTSDVAVARFNIEHRFPWSHQLSLSTEYSHSGGSAIAGGFNTFSAFATYSIPLNIRVHRSRASGLIRGRLTHGRTEAGLGGVPVFLGQDGQVVGGVLTSETGEFYLSDVPTGAYDLRVGTDQLDGNFVVRQGERVPTEVEGGDISEVNLQVVNAGELRLQVVAEPPAADEGCIVQGSQPRGPMGGVAVEVRRPGQRPIRGFTDVEGRLRLQGLQPGPYTIYPLPAFFAGLEPASADSLTVEVTDIEVAETTFALRPVCRRVEYASETTLALSTSSARSRIDTPPASPASERRSTGEEGVHVVKPGEWLSQIAAHYYGAGRKAWWHRIYHANRSVLSDPDYILPGQRLRIPAPPE